MEKQEIPAPVMIGIVVAVVAVIAGIWWFMAGRTEAAQAEASKTSKPPPWFDAAAGRPRTPGTTSSPKQ